MATKLQMVPLDKITVGRRYREDLGDMETLVSSIKEKGVLQPITLQKDYTLAAGGRRYEAAKRAGLDRIPALIRDTDDEIELREVELIENTFRSDFTWQERAKLTAELHRLMQEKHSQDWSTRKTAQLLGQSHPMNIVRALQLTDAITHVPELANCKSADEAFKILKKVEETMVHEELRNRQKEQAKTYGVNNIIRVADANYRIGDAMEGMSALKDNSMFHLIEVDPPYGIDLNTQKRQEDGTNLVQTYNEVPTADYAAFVEILAEETFRVAYKDAWCIFWFGPTHFELVRSSLAKAGWTVDDIPAIWTKGAGQTNAPEVNLARCYEPFFIARKGRPVLNKRGRSNVFDFTPVAGQKKYHPTERPLPLMMELLETFTLPNQSVLVPFLGSGVTLRACYQYGVKGMGWDKNGEYKDRFMLAVQEDTKQMNKEE